MIIIGFLGLKLYSHPYPLYPYPTDADFEAMLHHERRTRVPDHSYQREGWVE